MKITLSELRQIVRQEVRNARMLNEVADKEDIYKKWALAVLFAIGLGPWAAQAKEKRSIVVEEEGEVITVEVGGGSNRRPLRIDFEVKEGSNIVVVKDSNNKVLAKGKNNEIQLNKQKISQISHVVFSPTLNTVPMPKKADVDQIFSNINDITIRAAYNEMLKDPTATQANFDALLKQTSTNQKKERAAKVDMEFDWPGKNSQQESYRRKRSRFV